MKRIFNKDNKQILAKILQYFIQGLIVIAPIAITFYAIIALFTWIDGIIPNIIGVIFPSLVKLNFDGSVQRIPGLGFIVVIVLVIVIGRLSSLFFVGKLVDVLDKVLEKTPGIKFIYSAVKDFFEAFAGDKKKFDKPVLVNVDAAEVWRIGFITKDSANDFDLKDSVVVYVPHSYAISGITYIVPSNKIKTLKNISAANAMKFVVSGGVVNIDDEIK